MSSLRAKRHRFCPQSAGLGARDVYVRSQLSNYGRMDLSLIGPDRREVTDLNRIWLTLADFIGLAIGAALAVVLIVLLAF
jgi:hypothetical protein